MNSTRVISSGARSRPRRPPLRALFGGMSDAQKLVKAAAALLDLDVPSPPEQAHVSSVLGEKGGHGRISRRTSSCSALLKSKVLDVDGINANGYTALVRPRPTATERGCSRRGRRWTCPMPKARQR